MSQPNRALEELVSRVSEERLFYHYQAPYDHSQPFGPNNVGPYQWQVDFHNAGLTHTERLLLAANRLGKTRSGAAEWAMHATGMYPKWWEGRRFGKQTRLWCGSESWTSSRDIIQTELLGPIGQEGTGWIPKESIVDFKKRQAGISDVIESIRVKHRSGGISQIVLKTYEQQRKEWMGAACDGVWFDEEPPFDIYTEGLTRIIDRKGIILVTFTNLKGANETVLHFINPPEGTSIFVKSVGWDAAPHLDDKMKAELVASYPEHEIEARTKGAIMMGSGAIFPIRDEDIMCDPFDISKMDWWALINGVDFGIDHPGAGAFCAFDRDADTFYVYDCYKKSGETPVYHAAALKKYGDWIPAAWPHDGFIRDKGNAVAIKNQFRGHGVRMLGKHAQYPDERQNSREAGLQEMYEYMRTGRFKVFSTLSEWFEEKRMYHRKDGVVVPKFDDILCLHGDTNVLTRSGRIPIRDLVGTEGDVLSIDGEFMAYKNCRMTQENADIVKVRFDDGAEIRCTANHLFLANTGWTRADELVGHSCYNSISCSMNGDKVWSQLLSAKIRLAAENVGNVCVSVEPVGKSDVYCMSVPGPEAFAVENGVVVHNCATRYAFVMRRYGITRPMNTVIPQGPRRPIVGGKRY